MFYRRRPDLQVRSAIAFAAMAAVLLVGLAASTARAATLYPLYIFQDNGTDGQRPNSGVIQARDGNYYGTTNTDGQNNTGSIYQWNPTTQTITFIHIFTPLLNGVNADGATPNAKLIQGIAPDNKLYGVCSLGGQFQLGTAFSVNTDGTGFTTLHAFNGTDGQNPNNGLIEASDGTLYGTTSGLTNPDSGGTDGSLFSISATGVFSFTPFTGANGQNPFGDLIIGQDGLVYGSTFFGETAPGFGNGVLFSTDSTLTPTIFYQFLNNGTTEDGTNPEDGLFQAPDGSFYVTTSIGGVNNDGTVDKISKTGATTSTLDWATGFAATNGQSPLGPVMMASDGNLYGTTQVGGANANGNIYQVTPAGVISNIYSFTNGNDCLFPLCGLLLGSDGYLYGTASAGGPQSFGNLFKFSLDPVIKSISPSEVTAGRPQFTMTVTGANFNKDTVVQISDANMATTFVSPTELTAVIPATAVNAAGTYPIGAMNLDGVAGSSSLTVDGAPSSLSASPSSGVANSGNFPLTITGINLLTTDTVTFGTDSGLVTTSPTAGQLQATIPGADITAINPAIPMSLVTVDNQVFSLGSFNSHAGAATHFTFTVPASSNAGSSFNFTITAVDAFGNVATGYNGTVHFTSSDPQAGLPADATLVAGVGNFSATLKTSGNQTITGTDTVTASITGTSAAVAVAPGPATHFSLPTPTAQTAGTAFNFTVTAEDAFGNTATTYAGLVHFTSTDGRAVLPGNSRLVNGIGNFSATLKTAGPQSVTATDTVTPGITGNTGPFVVVPGVPSQFIVAVPPSATAGTSFSFTVTAEDAFGNVTPGYDGFVHFTSNDPNASLPANSTLTAGVGTFSATFKTSGARTITAKDSGAATPVGTSASVAVGPGPAATFTVIAPANATAGVAINFTVTALDSFGNVATGYGGTVHFTSSDINATLPANGTLANGVGSFSATLRTATNIVIRAVDTVTGTINGQSGFIRVGPAAAASFEVLGPESASVAGVAFQISVIALDAFGNTATGYAGHVHFTSSDPRATLPPNSTLTNGQGTFNTTLLLAGIDSITATDTLTPAIHGNANILVDPGAAAGFKFGVPASAVAGVAFNFTITSIDAFGNEQTAYTGAVHFTSSDAQATLPANSTLTNGIGTFNATMRTAGSETITGTDTQTPAITSTSPAIAITPAAASRFTVVGPASATAGTATSVTVTAFDPFGNVATAYGGTVHFTSTDPNAALPPNGTLVAGTRTFSVTFKTAGRRTVTATDTVTAITGTSGITLVNPGPAATFTVTGPPSSTAGLPFNITVTALDLFGNVATGYTGTAHFTSTDPQATLPANSTLTAGVGTFSVTLKTVGSRTITATDTFNPAIHGSSAGINVGPGAASRFSVVAPASTTAGVAFNYTVTALDPFGNIATGYAGTIHFTSTDPAAVLPANSTLNAGVGTFAATLKTSGNRTITATNILANAGISGTSGVIAVSPAAASRFTVAAPASAIAGVAINVVVTAFDPFGNVATGYAGTVHFTSTDISASLPANGTLVNGVRTFSATLRTAGNQTITATDTLTAGISGRSAIIAVRAAAASGFRVTAPALATAGVPINFRVTAADPFGNTATAYSGTAHFTSTDPAAVLPPNATLVNGVGLFSATLKTAGIRTIRVADAVTPAIFGVSNNIDVTPGAASRFTIVAPVSTVAGVALNITVTAFDPFGNIATGYRGLAHFTSSDPAAGLPPNYTLVNGVRTLTATLRTAGNRTITATDTVNAAITGTSAIIAVAPAAASRFTIAAPTSTVAGVAFNFTVTAFDPFGNIATGYRGLAHFASTDPAAGLPPNYTLVNGVRTLPATLKTAGNRTITATDTVNAAITGTSAIIAVAPAAASRFTVVAPASTVAGVVFNFTVTAFDPFGNIATGYRGLAHFVSTDPAAGLPPNYTLVNGVRTLTATLRTAGNRTIKATDTLTATITGTSGLIAVSPAAAARFAVVAPAAATLNTPFNINVTAFDAFGNIATRYLGSMRFTSSDPIAVLPGNSGLTNGTGTFSVTIKTAGRPTVSTTDTINAAVTGTTNPIYVPLHRFAAGLQLISVPYDYAGSSIDSIMSVAGVKVSDWDAFKGVYDVTPTPPADTLHQGIGMWCTLGQTTDLLRAGADLTAATGSMKMSLAAGWNLIGDPYTQPVPLSTLRVTDGKGNVLTLLQANSNDVAYAVLDSYDPNSGSYVTHTSDSLQPYLGYWIQAFVPCTLTIPSPNGNNPH